MFKNIALFYPLLIVSAVGLPKIASSATIMPMGDSTTLGQYGSGFMPGSWRVFLDNEFTFTGPSTGNPAPGQIGTGHCGFSGVQSAWVSQNVSFWSPWLARADIVTYMYGINDLNQGLSASETVSNLKNGLRVIFSVKPSVRIVVCTVAPRRNGSLSAALSDVNGKLAEFVGELREEGFGVVLAPTDQAYLPVDTRMIDNLHPSLSALPVIADTIRRAIPELDGDVDGDGLVSIQDYLSLSAAYDREAGQSGWNPAADFDRDSVVSILDYLLLSSNYERTKWD